MKILYVNAIETNAGWGAECFVNRGFIANGHETITIDYRKKRGALGECFKNIKEDFDVMLLQRGEYFPIPLLRAVNRPKVFWASELVSRNRDQDRLLRSGLFEHVFLHSADCLDIVVEKGWLTRENASPLINGFDETVQRPIDGIEKDMDVLFVGNVTQRRRNILDQMKRHIDVHEANAYGKGMTELMNRSRIVLNIHAEEYLDTETRVFEALGCGAFLLTEKLSRDNPFTPNIHYAQADSVEDFVSKSIHYLKNENERTAIAAQGHKEALNKHTYTVRAREIADVLMKSCDSKDGPPIDNSLLKQYIKKEKLSRALAPIKKILPVSLKHSLKNNFT